MNKFKKVFAKVSAFINERYDFDKTEHGSWDYAAVAFGVGAIVTYFDLAFVSLVIGGVIIHNCFKRK